MSHRPQRNRLLLCWLVAGAAIVSAQNAVDPSIIPVPAYSGSVYLGEIVIQFTTEEIPLLRPSSLVDLLRDRLADEVLELAATLYAEPDWARFDELSPLGLVAVLDWETLSVIVEIPPHLTRPQTIHLAGARPAPRGTHVLQSTVSLVANMDLWARYRYEDRALEASFTPELAVNYSRAVVEAKGGIRTAAPILFLDYARFVWDFPSIAYRLEAGDLTFLNTNLSDVGAVTGVSFVRQLALFGPTRSYGSFLQELSLATGSDVTITLNDSRIQNRFLDSGNYLVTGFPVVQGINTIIIAWQAADGPREVELVVPADPELKRAGEFDSGLAIGIADRDFARPVAAAYQTVGLSDYFTVGVREGIELVNLQIDLGLSATLATTSGTFLLTPDLLIGPTGRLAVDVPLAYRYLDSRRSSYRSFGLTTGMTAGRADAAATMEISVYGSGFFNLAFADGFSITPRAFYSYSTGSADHFVQLRASLRKSIRGGSSLTADLGFVYDQGPGFVATVSYSASFPERRQNLFMQQDLAAQKFSAYWSRYAGEQLQDIDLSASAQVPVNFDDVTSLSAQIGYNNPFLRGSLAHGFTGIINQTQFANATTARVQSAVVMADGQFGISVPVSDSFVIVVPGESTIDIPLRVNRTAAGTDFDLLGGGGVMPNLTSYAPTEISVEPQDLVLGSDDKELRYYVVPSYRSGALIRVELERNIYVGGVLADPAGAAMGYQFGRWEMIDSTAEGEEADARAATGEFFTDESGYFEIYNLSPGEYRLQVGRHADYRFSFVVPREANEFHDLETVQAGVE